MTNNQIMQANLLDIVFEDRNKEYGAYALRNGYNKRLLVALGAGMFVILAFILFTLPARKDDKAIAKKEMPGLVIKEYVLPQEKPKEPEKPRQVTKSKPKAPAVITAQVKFTTPVIKETVNTPVPPVEDLAGKIIADNDKKGELDKGIVTIPVKEPGGNGEVNNSGPSNPTPDFVIQEKDPEFPGGQEGLQKFLSRYLSTPGGLNSGEKKVVKVKFKVDKDGSVNTFEIVTSGGNEYDNEVVRVCKKMPKWIPAIQNGVNVPVSYVLPVTFIGLEE
ncbi:MAG: TonB family protein [Chitinophagaceae bacterium]|nr:TonB family protein [Chitinophagaceae bacterium]